jgi:3-oxoacyl-[acyl-carrier-protein] synthase II
MADKPLAVTGTGFISPQGIGDRRFLDTAGKTLLAKSRLDEYDPEGYLGKKGLAFLNNATKLFSSVVFQALSSGSLRDILAGRPSRTGIYNGSELVNLVDDFEFDLCAKHEGPDRVSPMKAPNTLANVAAGHVAVKAAVTGPNFTLSAGAGGGLQALQLAGLHLAEGAIELAIVGSTEIHTPYHRALARGRSPQPLFPPSPELAIALALEPEDAARERGAGIQGTLAGFASGKAPAGSRPEGKLARTVLQARQATRNPAAPVDALLLAAGAERIGDAALAAAFGGEAPGRLLRTEELHGSCENAGGLLGVLLAMGLLDGRVDQSPLPWAGAWPGPAETGRGTLERIAVCTLDTQGLCVAAIVQGALP